MRHCRNELFLDVQREFVVVHPAGLVSCHEYIVVRPVNARCKVYNTIIQHKRSQKSTRSVSTCQNGQLAPVVPVEIRLHFLDSSLCVNFAVASAKRETGLIQVPNAVRIVKKSSVSQLLYDANVLGTKLSCPLSSLLPIFCLADSLGNQRMSFQKFFVPRFSEFGQLET
jgi:hypothetical protein